MSGRRAVTDPIGPIGNPDGSRADLEEVLGEFVDFDVVHPCLARSIGLEVPQGAPVVQER